MIEFGSIYPKIQKLHIALDRLKEAHKEESLLMRTQIELDAASSILNSILDLEKFILDIDKRLGSEFLEVKEEERELAKKYPPETINDLRDKVIKLLDQAQSIAKELRKEEIKEEKEL